MFLGALAFAAGMAFLLNFFLAGPKLGALYDFLLKRQKPPAVSREILIINTGDFIESGSIFSFLMTLTEMEASNLILAGRVSPSSSPVTLTETEIRRRFIDEYLLIGNNIRSLFEAIRSGFVSPLQAPGFVEQLVELTDRSRDRLLTALINRDEDLLRSIAVFGNYHEVSEMPVFDRDGVLRRVLPVDQASSIEHPVFSILKQRYDFAQIETIDTKQILWLRRADGERDISLDKNGNIISSQQHAFRQIDISLFLEYEEADRAMRSAMIRANELGVFSQTLPEDSPLFLYDYALTLQGEMLNSFAAAVLSEDDDDILLAAEAKGAWKEARNRYFVSLNEFLAGHAQTALVRGYEEVITEESSLGEEGLYALAGMLDELRQSFALLREEYGRLSSVRAELESELAASFCIMGPVGAAKYPAVLANALITGIHIKPADDMVILLCSITAAFIVLLAIIVMRPSVSLFCGIGLSVFAAAAFGIFFVLYSYWIDPLIVLASSLAGTLAVFYCKCAIVNNRARRFRFAYGAAVSPNVVKELIKTGKPRLSDIIAKTAAVIAIKDINLFANEDRENPQDARQYKKDFLQSVKKAAHAGGAIIAGFEGDTILVCFGSPLDRSVNPAGSAYALVKELLNNEGNTWRFGIDCGECNFFWSPETGYSVNGRPAVRARILASRAKRLKTRALITGSVQEKINVNAKKIDSLSGGRESVHEFPPGKR